MSISVPAVVSGLGSDSLTGSGADETFVFKAVEQDDGTVLGWGTDTLASGGGADRIDLSSIPDGWRWEGLQGAGPGDPTTIQLLDETGTVRPSKILLRAGDDFLFNSESPSRDDIKRANN